MFSATAKVSLPANLTHLNIAAELRVLIVVAAALDRRLRINWPSKKLQMLPVPWLRQRTPL